MTISPHKTVNTNFTPLAQGGFSLIEIMIASMIGVFITSGILTLYISNKDTYRLQESISYVQRNGNFALDQLKSKIQIAGYSGFYQSFTAGVENRLNNTDDRWNISQPIRGFDNVSSSNAYVGITGLKAGTDAVLLKSMVETTRLKTDSTTTSAVLGASGYSAGDILIVADPDQASIFQVTTADGSVANQTSITIVAGSIPSPGNDATLNNIYGSNASIGKLETIFFYLKESNGISTLYKTQLTTSADAAPVMVESALISNVENLQITYGVDTDDNGSVDGYETATTINTNNQWGLVKIVGISMLLASDSASIATENNSYTFNSTQFTYIKDAQAATGADKRLRRVFTSYVSINN